MKRRPQRSTRTETLIPYTTLCRAAVKREMMIELVDDDMGERGKAGLAACNGLRRRRSLADLVAGAEAILGPHGADDEPLDRGDVELLVAVVAKRAQHAAAKVGRASRMESVGLSV